MRTDRYKVVHFYDSEEWELFDLAEDPHEMWSLYGDPAYQGIAEKLKVELKVLRAQYGVGKT